MAQHTVVVEQASTEEKKKRKKLPFILGGIGVLAIVPLVGSTFAASITLNTSSNIEFGQGTVNASACDPNIKVGLTSDIVNVSGTGNTFALGKITLVDSASGSLNSLCAGKTLTIRLAKSDASLLQLGAADSATTIDVDISGDGNTATVYSGAGATYAGSGDITDGVISVTPGSANLFHSTSAVTVSSQDVATVLLESKDTPTR